MPHAPGRTSSIGPLFQGRYEILSELGTGSFGRVYKARQLSTGQEVAIKVLRLRDGATPAEIENQIERFRREMRLCVELTHPNLVRLIDSGESDDGILYAVFEYVPGETLKDVLANQGKLEVPETVRLMTQVLDALSCAHARGVVHRDLKPENIMVSKTGARRNALVLDFGLGGFAAAQEWRLPRLTATREMMGTPCYAAPEQLRGEPPTTRSDLYSWGLIFLECLTGELAVSGGSAQEVVLKQLGPDPIPIPPWLRSHRLGRLLEIVTAKTVERRDVTIDGLLQVLDQAAGYEPSAAPGGARTAPVTDGERRQLTVVSCRLTVGSADGESVDVEELDELLHAQHARYAELASRNGGQLASVMADRVLIVFGYPQAREDDARRAARTALQIVEEVGRSSARLEAERRRWLQVRLGVHTGLVIVRELRQVRQHGLCDVVGLTPQIAVRLEELAEPGEVVVSRETQRLLRNEIGVQPLGERQLSAATAPRPVFRLSGALRSGGGLETIERTRETLLVGRSQQLQELVQFWAQAEAGKSGTVLITGEPGIGKSRLVRELRRRVPTNAWLECRCFAESQDSPLRPIVDLLLAAAQPLDALLTRYDLALDEYLPLFATLLSLPLDDRYAPLELTADRQKELTLSAVQSLLWKMAEDRPLVLALEDLQWADPTTLELIAQLVQEVRSAQVLETAPVPRMLLVFTARPEFTPPWSMDDMALIQLPRLTRQDIEEMLSAGLAGDTPLPRAVLDQVIRRADGVPLFVEEVTRMLIEAGTLSEPAEGIAESGPDPLIPGTLRDLLTARLDGLSPGARDTAQLAAVLGREFRYEHLRVLCGKDESTLRENLHELAATGLVYHRRSIRSESYVFKHALVCDAAYESMVTARRQTVHQRVANTLQQRFPEIEQNQPGVLALHFEKGGQIANAVVYWHRAGARALRRAAYVEAINQLQRGLVLLRTIAEGPERARQEVDVLTTLGMALLSTNGYAAAEVEGTFAAAWQLCEQLGEDIPLKVLYGIWGVRLTRSDREGAAQLVPRFRRLAERATDAPSLITAFCVLAADAFCQGDFSAADTHAARAIRLHNPELSQRFAQEWGYDPSPWAFIYQAWSRWSLGYADQAHQVANDLLAFAERVRDPYATAMALSTIAVVAYHRGDVEQGVATAERLMQYAIEQKLYLWAAMANCTRGGFLRLRGDTEAAIAEIEQGLNLHRLMGVTANYTYYLAYLAAAYLDAGKLEESLTATDEGLSHCHTLLSRFTESEFLRLKGDVLLAQNDYVASEACLRQALDVAARQQAKAYELRATTSLSRLLRLQGNDDEARELLQGIHGWFTEGFETKDLRDARTLLAELS